MLEIMMESWCFKVMISLLWHYNPYSIIFQFLCKLVGESMRITIKLLRFLHCQTSIYLSFYLATLQHISKYRWTDFFVNINYEHENKNLLRFIFLIVYIYLGILFQMEEVLEIVGKFQTKVIQFARNIWVFFGQGQTIICIMPVCTKL